MRRYQQLLQLWLFQTDIPYRQCGAAIVGRLRGSAFQFAMRMQEDRLDMNAADGTRRIIKAPELFAELPHDAWTSPGAD